MRLEHPIPASHPCIPARAQVSESIPHLPGTGPGTGPARGAGLGAVWSPWAACGAARPRLPGLFAPVSSALPGPVSLLSPRAGSVSPLSPGAAPVSLLSPGPVPCPPHTGEGESSLPAQPGCGGHGSGTPRPRGSSPELGFVPPLGQTRRRPAPVFFPVGSRSWDAAEAGGCSALLPSCPGLFRPALPGLAVRVALRGPSALLQPHPPPPPPHRCTLGLTLTLLSPPGLNPGAERSPRSLLSGPSSPARPLRRAQRVQQRSASISSDRQRSAAIGIDRQ